MSEENKSGDNGKEQPQFRQFIKIFFNDQTGDYAFETNVPNTIIGFGMLEFGKKGVEAHILKAQQNKILPAKGGLMNFARRIMK